DALMDTLGEVDMEDLHDEYREALEEVVAAKAAGEIPPEAPAPAAGGKVLDLMAALEKSVRAAKESRGEAPAEPAEPEKSEVRDLPQRKSARTAPKRTGGKKSTSTAKKTAASGTARKSTAKSAQGAKKAAASKSTAKSTAKKTAAKKTPAKKTAARKRTA
ncbi:Ku protein, partial [Streptomyces sp. NPDC052015]